MSSFVELDPHQDDPAGGVGGTDSVLAGYSFSLRSSSGDAPTDGGLGRARRVIAEHLVLLGARETTATEDPGEPGAGTGGLHARLTGPDAQVRCHLDGWGGLGSGAFSETLVQARCGLMAVHGRSCGGPQRLGVDFATSAAAVVAVQGLLASVLAAQRGGAARDCDLAVARVALLLVGQYLAGATAHEDPETIPTLPDAEHRRPPFLSADGVAFELETLAAEPWQAFWAALDADPTAVGRSWRPFLLRYAQGTAPLAPGLHDAVARVPFAILEEIARDTGVSVCRIRSLAERRGDPGGPPWSVTPLGASGVPARRPDGPLPLSGLRVVESCRRVQGPLAGQLLSMLGATVVRVEPPGGDPLRGMPPMAGDASARFVALNRGKEIVEADIKSARGRRHLRDLVAGSDVFLHNWAPGKAAALGLDGADLAAASPGLVYAYPSGWGDVLGEDPPLGTDFMVQAYSGVADVASGTQRPRPSLVTLLDLFGGLVCTEGILAGLVARHRDRRGRLVGSSLLSASEVLLSDELRDPASARQEALSGLEAAYSTADRPLAISAATPTARAALREVCRGEGLDRTGADDDPPAEVLARTLASASATEWAERLTGAGVPCEPVATDLAQMSTDPRLAPALSHEPGCAIATSPWSFR